MICHTWIARGLAGLALAVAVPLSAADSPRFRGASADGVYREQGLLQSWPEAGPRRLWVVGGLGHGFASVTVAEGRLYTTGMDDARQGSVSAFDREGRLLWKKRYGKEHSGNGYPGTRTTPTFDGGALYLHSSLGHAVSLDTARGAVRWQVDLAARFGARNITWGISESPLVDGGRVILTPGGSNATLVALDKESGETIWATSGIGDASAYCSPRVLEEGGRRQIVTATAKHLVAVDPASGRLLWKHPYPGRYDIHAVSPLFDGSTIFVSDGYGQGSAGLRLTADGRGLEPLWTQRKLDVHHGGMVLREGVLYGAASNGHWHALDATSGEILASIPRLGKGAVVYADGRLYGYVERGRVALVDPDPEAFSVVGSFQVTEGEGQHWAHPVISDGVLYIRHGDALLAYDVRAPKSAAQAVRPITAPAAPRP